MDSKSCIGRDVDAISRCRVTKGLFSATIDFAHGGSACDDLSVLRAGDACLLTGSVYTARDATCMRLVAQYHDAGKLPYGLEGQILFFAGPTPPQEGRPIGSIGPTTARRMDKATVELMDGGLAATLGKGSRSPMVADACKRNGGVYFGAVGGIAALLAKQVISAEMIAYDDLGTEALMRLTLDRFPMFVALDSQGADWYEQAPIRYSKSSDA